jgi:hypothetical protein
MFCKAFFKIIYKIIMRIFSEFTLFLDSKSMEWLSVVIIDGNQYF